MSREASRPYHICLAVYFSHALLYIGEMKFQVLLHISISLFEMYVDVPHCVFYDHDPPVNVLWDRHCYDNIIYIYDIYGMLLLSSFLKKAIAEKIWV